MLVQVKRLVAAERINAPDYVMTTLISAVVMVLVTRALLQITGYPQLAHGGLHIAHILYGGVLMFGAGLLTLSYHGRAVRYTTAMLLGAGFGLFVDEAGKFLTHDNNYFYRPTVIVIYVCFLLLFYLYRALKRAEAKTPRSWLYQAFEEMEEIIETDFEPIEKAAVMESLNQAVRSGHEPLATFARRLKVAVDHEPVRPDHTPKVEEMYLKFKHWLYRQTLAREWLVPVLAGVFGIYGLVSLGGILFRVLTDPSIAVWEKLMAEGVVPTNTNIVMFLLQTLMRLGVTGLIVVGLVKLKRDRLGALEYFYKALMVRILLGDIFTFYFEQFSAAVAVGIDLMFLVGINKLIGDEKRKHRN